MMDVSLSDSQMVERARQQYVEVEASQMENEQGS